jgi:hypothetical protein
MNWGMKSACDGQNKNRMTARITTCWPSRADRANQTGTDHTGWVKSVPLELLLAVGTILYHTKALKR